MKVASWVFTVLSYLAIPILFAFWAILQTDDAWWQILIIGGVLFCILGYIGHILALKYKMFHGGGCTVPYILTFPAFLIPFVIIGVIWLVLSLVNFICYLITDRYLMSELLNWIKRDCLGIGGDSSSQGQEETIYVVYDGGFERKLKMWTHYKQDFYNPSLYYDRLIDDIGNYWRSYDDCRTFRKETIEEKERGY